jgi:hypothetical protein
MSAVPRMSHDNDSDSELEDEEDKDERITRVPVHRYHMRQTDCQNVYGIKQNRTRIHYQIPKMKVQEVENIVKITQKRRMGNLNLDRSPLRRRHLRMGMGMGRRRRMRMGIWTWVLGLGHRVHWLVDGIV